MTDKEPHRRMSTTEAAAAFGVNPRTISKWIESGRIKGIKEEGRWIVLIPSTDGRLNEGGPLFQAGSPSVGGSQTATDKKQISAQTESPSDEMLDVDDDNIRTIPTQGGPYRNDRAAQGPPINSGPPVIGPAIDLGPIAELIADLTRRNVELASVAAMWQERSANLENRTVELDEKIKYLEAGPIAEPEIEKIEPDRDLKHRGFWARLFLGPDL